LAGADEIRLISRRRAGVSVMAVLSCSGGRRVS
jgi:hypothetical protein